LTALLRFAQCKMNDWWVVNWLDLCHRYNLDKIRSKSRKNLCWFNLF
jgi:hypothetical protein